MAGQGNTVGSHFEHYAANSFAQKLIGYGRGLELCSGCVAVRIKSCFTLVGREPSYTRKQTIRQNGGRCGIKKEWHALLRAKLAETFDCLDWNFKLCKYGAGAANHRDVLIDIRWRESRVCARRDNNTVLAFCGDAYHCNSGRAVACCYK